MGRITLGSIPGQTLESIIIDDEEVTFSNELVEVPRGGSISRWMLDQWYRDQGLDPNDPEKGIPRVMLGRRANGDFKDNVWIHYHDGRQSGANDYLLEAYGTGTDWAERSERPWTADMVGVGTPYVVITFRFERKLFTGLPRCKFVVGGIPLYDPRRDSTAGGTGTQRWFDPSTWAISHNPMVQSYNILRGIPIEGGPYWGLGVEGEDLPLSAWSVAMNACDETVDGEPRYRAGFEISVDDEPLDILEELLKTCSGQLSEFGGVWKPRVGGPKAPVYFLTDDDVIISKESSYKPFPGLAQTFNGVQGSYPDPEQLWQAKDAPPRYNAAYEAKDQGRRRVADLSLPACPYKKQVQRLMRAYIEGERRFAIHKLHLPPEADVLEALDAVSWSSVQNGYSTKVFEIADAVDDPESGTVGVVMRERDNADYGWQPGFLLPSTPSPSKVVRPPVFVPQFFIVEGIALKDQAGKDRRPALQLRWGGLSLEDMAGMRYEIQRGAEVMRGTMSDPESGSVVVSAGILPQTTYLARICFTPEGKQAVDWSEWKSATTPPVFIGEEDFADGVRGLFESAGVTAPSDIPDTSVPGTEVDELAWSRADGKFYRWDGSKWVDHLQQGLDELLEETLIAQGLTPPKRVDALPATGSLGDYVILEADGKMYRWDGTAWVTGVKVEDIDGLIPGDKLQPGTVPAEAIAEGAIGAEQISNELEQLIRDQGQSASADKAAAEAAAALAVEAKGDAETAATASTSSRDMAAASASLAGQQAAAASNAKVDAETARGQAQTSATQAAQSKTSAEQSAAAAATSQVTTATTLTTAQRLLNTARVMLPSVPDVAAQNFSAHVTNNTPLANANYQSDAIGPFALAPSAAQNASLGPIGTLPLSADKVYRVTMRFWSASGARLRLHFVYLDAAGNRIINTNHVFRAAGNPFPAGEIITHTVTLGANAGGLVDLQVTNANWQTAARIRFALDTAVVQTEPFKLYEFRIEDVTEADAAARHAKLSADAATASATSATQAAASETAAGQSAGAAASAKIEAETARGQAQTSATQAAQSKTDADGSASAAAASAGVSAVALTDLQKALASSSAILTGTPSAALKAFGTINSGLPDTYPASPDSFYGSDADGNYFQRTASSSGHAFLRGVVSSALDKVYRVSARVKASHAMSIRIAVAWVLSNGEVHASGGYGLTDFAAGEIKTISMVLGRTAGGLVTQTAGNDGTWTIASAIRFGLTAPVGVSGAFFNIYEIRVDDLSEADAAARSAGAAGVSASAAAASASSAAASQTAAGQSAAAAAHAKIEAETARGQAQVASGQAAQSSTDAAGSASQAQSHAALAAIAKDDAGNSASAAAASSVTATTKASEAGESASLASNHAGAAQTQAGIATSKAAEALSSASGAAGSATEAKSFSQLAALALSGGSAKNPTFLDWSGVFPPHIGVVAGSSGTIGKAVGKYGYAFELVTTSVATVGPYVFHDKTTLHGVTNPQKLLITIEAEPLSGSLAGMVLQCGWHDAPTNSWGWAAVRIGPNLTVGGGIQTYQAVIERPAAWAAGKTIDDVSIRFMPSYETAGATAAINRVKLHRFDAQVILADSYIDQQLKTKATLDGLAETSYVMRVKAGGASAGLEMVAASNPNGPASAIRMSADEILFDGTIKGPMMEIGAIGAREIAVNAIAARHMLISDSTNYVPDDQLQDDASWVKGIAIKLRPITPRGDIKSVGDLLYTHADNVNNNDQFAANNKFFPVTPGDELFVSGQMIRAGGTKMRVWVQIQFFDKNDVILATGGTATAATYNGTANTAQPFEGAVPVPAGAMTARYRFMVRGPDTDGNVVFGAPTVRIKSGGKLILDGDLEGRHFKFETITGGLMAATGIITKVGQIDNAVIRRAHIGLGEIDELRIKGNAFFVPYRFTAATVQIPTANHIANQRLLLDRSITGLGDGGFLVTVNAYMATTTHYDCFGGLSLTTTIDGVITGTASGLQRFGIRTTGGDTGFRIPIAMSASAFGGATVRFQLYGYNGHWTGDFERINAETGQYVNPRSSNPFNIEGITLSVSASRR